MRALLAATALAVALTPAAAQAADSCPNAALRTGVQATMPDCRAWEQVSPTEKNGVGFNAIAEGYASPAGDRLLTYAGGAVVPTPSGFQQRGFMLAQTADGWSIQSTDAPSDRGQVIGSIVTQTVSDDGTAVLVAADAKLTADAVAGNTNLYRRDLTRPDAYELLVSAPGLDFLRLLQTGSNVAFDATPDLRTVAFATDAPVIAGVADATTRVYVASQGRATLVSRDPADGAPVYATVGSTTLGAENRLSDDGRTMLWATGAFPGLFRTTVATGATVDVTAVGTGITEYPADSSFSTPDGAETIFAVTANTTGRRVGIYRYRRSEAQLTELTALAAARGDIVDPRIKHVSADRDTVVFTTVSRLTDDATAGADGDQRLYALDASDRSVRLLGTFDSTLESLDVFTSLRFSSDGKRVALRAYTPLAGADTTNERCRDNNAPEGRCAMVYTWDLDASRPAAVCASCAPGVEPASSAQFGPGESGVRLDGRLDRAILDDGRTFFDTASRLSGADIDASRDVYQFTPGAGPALLTAGDSGADAYFATAGENGANVFFNTTQRLLAQDVDGLTDVYVARTNGGIAAQRVAPPAAAQPCEGDGCRPGPGPQPARPDQGSRDVGAPASALVPRFSVARPSARTLRGTARTGRLRLSVKVNAPGRLVASLRRGSRTVASATSRATKAQTVRLTLRLSKRARRQLRRSGKLSLRLTVRWSDRLAPYRTTLTIRKGGAR